MSIININGFILASRPYREKDKLLTIYSSATGKLQVLCKAGRDPVNRWTSSMDPPVLGWFSLFEKNHFYQLIDIKEMNVFHRIRQNYRCRLVFHALLQAMVHLPFSEPAESLFHLLLETLYAIDMNEDSSESLYYRFMIRYIGLQGFHKRITHCHQCNAGLSAEHGRIYFSGKETSFICLSCAKIDTTAMLLPENIQKFWAMSQESPIQFFLSEKSVFFHNFKDLDRIISVIVKQVFPREFATLAELAI